MAFRVSLRHLRNWANQHEYLARRKFPVYFVLNRYLANNSGMKSSNSDWKMGLERLLTPRRGPDMDGMVSRQQKYASVFFTTYRHAGSLDERKTILKHVISTYGHSTIPAGALSLVNGEEKRLSDIIKVLKDSPPVYYQLFRAIGQLENGIKFLVDLRADVLVWLKEMLVVIPGKESGEEEIKTDALKLMNYILRELLSIWFSVGLLDVQRVTWKSPCDILQRIAEYESVHPVRSWADLKSRVGPGRRCFIFLHPSMPREPLVVLHVALMDRIPERIADVISSQRMAERSRLTREENLDNVNAAIFYSISSTQPGLQGIDLGHFLIKRVAQQLNGELPTINAFSSLSPIPGFRKWLIEEMRRREKGNANERLPIDTIDVSLIERGDWHSDETQRCKLRPILLRLCAHYLTRVKHRGYAYDPVANFHLRNGAVIWRINWEGDTTAKGLKQSCSIMVNYRYYLDQTEENSRAYLEEKQIRVDDQVLAYMTDAAGKISHL